VTLASGCKGLTFCHRLHPDAKVPTGYFRVELGKAKIVRPGEALTVLAYGTMVHVAEAVIAEAGIGIAHGTRAIEIHATVEFEQDVFRRSVGAGNDGEVAVFDHGNGGPVAVFLRRGARGITTVGQSVGIEGNVAVGSIFAGDGDARNFLAVLIKRDGGAGPEGR
jgi:hypothetical protein